MNTIVRKCVGKMKFLYRLAGCLPPAIKKTVPIACPVVQCYIDYGGSSWYAAMTWGDKNKLQIVQNKMGGFILDLRPKTHHMTDLTLRVPERARQ